MNLINIILCDNKCFVAVKNMLGVRLEGLRTIFATAVVIFVQVSGCVWHWSD